MQAFDFRKREQAVEFQTTNLRACICALGRIGGKYLVLPAACAMHNVRGAARHDNFALILAHLNYCCGRKIPGVEYQGQRNLLITPVPTPHRERDFHWIALLEAGFLYFIACHRPLP